MFTGDIIFRIIEFSPCDTILALANVSSTIYDCVYNSYYSPYIEKFMMTRLYSTHYEHMQKSLIPAHYDAICDELTFMEKYYGDYSKSGYDHLYCLDEYIDNYDIIVTKIREKLNFIFKNFDNIIVAGGFVSSAIFDFHKFCNDVCYTDIDVFIINDHQKTIKQLINYLEPKFVRETDNSIIITTTPKDIQIIKIKFIKVFYCL